MAIELKMPALSPTMEEGTLARWLVKEGDSVKSGDILAEIETDKATMEFEAVDEGVITSISVSEGTDGVKVGTVIGPMVTDGVSSNFNGPAFTDTPVSTISALIVIGVSAIPPGMVGIVKPSTSTTSGPRLAVTGMLMGMAAVMSIGSSETLAPMSRLSCPPPLPRQKKPLLAVPVLNAPVFTSPGLARPVLALPVLSQPVLVSPMLASPVLASPALRLPLL